MSSIETGRSQTPTPHDQDGNGPWYSRGNDPGEDIELLKTSIYEDRKWNILVTLPEINALSTIARGFVQIQDLNSFFWKTKYPHDELTTRVNLKQVQPNNSIGTLNVEAMQISKTLPYDHVLIHNYFNLFNSLRRMQNAALYGDTNSAEALKLLHIDALQNKRLMVINCHGSNHSSETPTGKRKRLYVTDDHGALISAESLIEEISLIKDSKFHSKYSAIYFTSCNEENASVETSHVPVIIHRDIHTAEKDGHVRICWPR